MSYTVYDITPVPQPRMVQSDRWNKRPRVLRYRAFRDECRLKKVVLPENYHVIFVMPMPKSWSGKKCKRMSGQPHRSKPDKDNLEKALLDAVYEEDSIVWDGRVTKVWGYTGKICVALIDPPITDVAA